MISLYEISDSSKNEMYQYGHRKAYLLGRISWPLHDSMGSYSVFSECAKMTEASSTVLAFEGFLACVRPMVALKTFPINQL